MPAVPSCLLEPIWSQVQPLLPVPCDSHPLGCHRPRIDDRLVFDKLVQVLVLGCSYEQIADATCSATTLRRRRDEWIAAGVMPRLETLARAGYDRLIGLQLEELAVDGCITKAPGGGERSGPSPVDRRKRGLKRSTVVEATGIPLGVLTAPAQRQDCILLAPTLDLLAGLGPLPAQVTVHLDRGYDYGTIRTELAARGLHPRIAERGKPAPVQAGRRWVVERTHAWLNDHRKLLICTERRARVIDFWIALANAIIIVRQLIRRAWLTYRWPGRPRRRP